MATLAEQEVYDLAVYLIEITDAVIGGANGIANLQAKQLANRTAWLKANKQDKDATLTALAALVTAADKMIYATGSDTFATTTLTAFARTVLDDVDAAAMRATLGAQVAGSYQASDATLTALAALVTAADKMIYATGSDTFATTTLTAFSRTLLDDVDAAAMRATLGAVSQTDINNAITALVNSSPPALDTLKELAIALGNDANFATTMTNALAGKQPVDATLTALAALVSAADKMIYSTGADTFAMTTLTAFARTLLDDADAATMRATLGALSNSSPQIAKAWVNFNTVPLGGVYSQIGTTITVTMTAHGMNTGMIANLDFTSGTATDSIDFVVTVIDANTFTVIGKTSATTTGSVTRNNYIRSAFNVYGITDNGVGDYTINFANPLTDKISLSGGGGGGGGQGYLIHYAASYVPNINNVRVNLSTTATFADNTYANITIHSN